MVLANTASSFDNDFSLTCSFTVVHICHFNVLFFPAYLMIETSRNHGYEY